MKKSLKSFLVAAVFLISAVVLTSCERRIMSDDELPELPPPVGAETQAVTTVPVVTRPPETSGVVVPEHLLGKKTTGLHPGIWYAYSQTGSSFYCFYPEPNERSGVKINIESGISSPFEYEKMESYYLFHFDHVDNNTSVNVEYVDTDHVNFEINGTYYEELEFVSDKQYNQLMFYTDAEIIARAKEHYAKDAANPRIVKVMDAFIIERPGCMVTVQLTKRQFNKETNETETVVCESYTVNRMNCKGVNSLGYEVDISQ